MTEKFSIIKTGGKQYIVKEGQKLAIERLTGHKDLKKGDKVNFDKVLLVETGGATQIGTPYLEGALVEATYLGEERPKKVTGVVFKNKTGFRLGYGHRHIWAQVKIDKIV